MHSVWRTSIRFTLVTAVLLGLGYPLLVTGIARRGVSAPGCGKPDSEGWAGDWVRVAGAELYFRQIFPSAAVGSGQWLRCDCFRRLNLAQSNKTLVDRIQGYIDKLAKENPGKPVPIDLVTMSVPGLIRTLRRMRPTLRLRVWPRLAV